MQTNVENATETLGHRVQRELRVRYGPHAAKRAAGITGADLRTARSWIEEAKTPRETHLRAIIREFGRDALLALFGPEIETHEQKLEREIHELREEIARREARLGQSGAPASPHAVGVASQAPHDRRINHNRDGRVCP